MFTKKSEDSISSLGEIELIASIGGWLDTVSPKSPEGMGDDCAVIDTSQFNRQLLTTDSVTYGQHFDASLSACDAGAKLIKRNLSDIAAMGGRPGSALLTLLSGSDLEIDWLRGFIDGIRQTCESYHVPIVGGDISALPEGQFSAVLSMTGQIEDQVLLRSGAGEGDSIYLTGTLGGSIYQKHYDFQPRLPEGQWLANSHACSAMMDLTDGLAKDLRALLPQGCSAFLDIDTIPVSQNAHHRSTETGRSALEHAFCDGEDYELLFTVKNNADTVAFEKKWSEDFPELLLTRIGHLGKSIGTAPYLDSTSREALPWVKGFEHLGGQ